MTNKQKSCSLAFFSAAVVLMLLSAACAAPFTPIENNSNKMLSFPHLVNNTITATIVVGENPTGVVISPDGTKVYVLNSGSNSVSVINVAKNTVVATMPVGLDPRAITIDSNGKKVYVLCMESVSVIDTSTNTVTATVSVGQDPLDFTIIPDGTKVYAANHDDNSVSVIDTATNTVKEIPVGEWPDKVVVSPDKKKVYVTYSNGVDVINTKTDTITATLPFIDVKVYSAGKKVYVVNSYGNKLSVRLINTKTNTVTAKAKVTELSSPDQNKIVFNPTGTKMYVADFWNNNVYVINTKTNTVISKVPLGAQPEEISVNPAGTMAYVVNGNNVSVINTKLILLQTRCRLDRILVELQSHQMEQRYML